MAIDSAARLIIRAVDETRAAWNSAVRNAESGSKRISGALKASFAGLSVAALGAALTKTVGAALEYGDAIGKAAIKSGLGTNAISELAFAAKGANVDLDSLSTSLRVMQINISKASDGSKPLLAAFEEIGIEFAGFRKLNPDQQFEILAEAINRVNDPADKARIAVELFGKAGAELLPLFADGANGLRMAREEAERLGLSMGPEQQKRLQDAGDAIGKLKEAAGGLGRELALAVGPSLTKFTNFLTELIAKANGVPASIEAIREEIKRLDADIALASQGSFKLFLEGRGDLDVEGAAEELAKRRAELQQKLKAKLAAKADQDKADGVLKEMIEIEIVPTLNLDGLSLVSSELREKMSAALAAGSETIEGGDLRERLLDAQFGNDQGRDARMERLAEANERYASEVLDGVSEQSRIAEESIDQSLARIEEKFTTKSSVLTGALEAVGASIQQNISATLLAAGDGAGAFKDRLLQSFKQILADFATKKLIESLAALGGSLSGTGGYAGAIGTGLSALFGGTKASGGPLDQGKWYVAGEKGPEPIWGGGPGAFAVGYGQQAAMLRGGGGGVNVVVNQTNNVDMRNSTKESANATNSQLPALFKRNNDQLKAEIRDAINRGQFGLK